MTVMPRGFPDGAQAGRATERRLLRFLTCGSVDDGKSTLIGRLLYDSHLILDDHLAAIAKDSRRYGSTGDELDLALLVDGLEAEREQGITIDVAHRYFSTARRSFIVADTPGHEQYTRNMVTGASGSDVAVILVDARKGVLAQTKRHATICSLLGIRHVAVAINKIDLVDHSREVFEAVRDAYLRFSEQLDFDSVTFIPMSARFGDNVAHRSQRTLWYDGPTLVEYLETVDVEGDLAAKPFRFSVQLIARPDADFRGYAGTVSAGVMRPGDSVVAARSGRRSQVARIVTADGDRTEASAGDAVTLTLATEIDVSRGDVLSHPDHRPIVSDQFAAHLLWMSEEALLPGRSYLMRSGTDWSSASVTAIRYRVDVHTLQHLAARKLELNEIAVCHLSTTRPVAFDPYGESRATGAFILVDRFTDETCAAGMITHELRRAGNIHRAALAVDRASRAALKGQDAVVLWFTGLSGAGKSTIANALELRLHGMGRHTYMLDGDNLRHGLCRDLGFTDADRVENIRRVGEVAGLMVDAGLIVLCAFISPFRAERQMVRDLVGPERFQEIFVDAPIEECIRRDPKGLYAKARSGEIKNFTGFDSPYDAPDAPDLRLETALLGVDAAVERIIAHLRDRSLLR